MLLSNHIQKYGLDQLHLWDIKITPHPLYPNLHHFKYNQIKTPINDVTRWCRGIILDADDNWQPVCWPYKRFANYGESWVDNLDWERAIYYEKLDGSLMLLWYYDNKWHVSTTGSPDASGNVNDKSFTFKELFWHYFNKLGYGLPNSLSGINTTYLFELITPENRIIIDYSRTGRKEIILHGIRDNLTGREEWPEILEQDLDLNWEMPVCHDIESLEDAKTVLNLFKPNEWEGFVAVDTNFNRVKIKSIDYLTLHRLKSSFTKAKLLDIVKTKRGEESEFLSYFPEFKDQYKSFKLDYDKIVNTINLKYESVKNIESQKEFALSIKDFKYKSALFALRANKVASIENWFENQDSKKLLGMIYE